MDIDRADAAPPSHAAYPYRVKLRAPRAGFGRYLRRFHRVCDRLAGGRYAAWTERTPDGVIVCWGFRAGEAALGFRLWVAERRCGPLLVPNLGAREWRLPQHRPKPGNRPGRERGSVSLELGAECG